MNTITKREIINNSVAVWYDPFVATFITVALFFALARTTLPNTKIALVIVLLNTIYFFSVELMRRSWDGKNVQTIDSKLMRNIFTKYLGILFGICLIIFSYWLFPEYAQAKYLNPIGEAKYIFLAIFLPVSFVVVAFTEYLLGPKEDNTFQFGLFVTLQIEKINWIKFRDGILEWLIRLVFLTLNFTSAVSFMNSYKTVGLSTHNFAGDVIWLEGFIFFIILLVILPGYVFSSRLIKTEVQKIDASWFAWTVLLICYQPFITPIFTNIFGYQPDLDVFGGSPAWIGVAKDIPFLIYVFGIGIILMALVHLWGEAIIGIRSSNISNRGIITNGPFAFTKHPVYISKCIGWAIISMPFFAGATLVDSIRLGLLFLGVCAIYTARAVSEERLLSTDQTYVEYALSMDKNSWFSFVGKIFPVMTFEWRMKYWNKHLVDNPSMYLYNSKTSLQTRE